MPFVGISLPASFTKEVKKNVSLSVHGSLVAIFSIPDNDYFQIIHTLEPENLIFPDSYLNISHTSNLIYIHIIFGTGRTVEMKKAL